MASNSGNFFITLEDERFSYDEYTYGPNYANGSSDWLNKVFSSAKIEVIADYDSGWSEGASITFEDFEGQDFLLIFDKNPTAGTTTYSGVTASLHLDNPHITYTKKQIADWVCDSINGTWPTIKPKVFAFRTSSGLSQFINITQNFPGEIGNNSSVVVTPTSHPEYLFEIKNQFIGGEITESISWTPTTSSIVLDKTIQTLNYQFSPMSFGNFRDVLYSPPEMFRVKSKQEKNPTPPVSTPLAISEYRLSANQDSHSRIFQRFEDRDVEDSGVSDGSYTPI